MTVAVIIQARTGSTRLPGKVMKRLMDRTVLGHVITRCLAMPLVEKVIIATTALAEDDVICREAENYGVSYYRGSTEDVLSRYYEAAQVVEANTIVRITSDCPLLDPNISNAVVEKFLQKKCDYMSTGLSGTFPRGLDTEVFSFAALELAYQKAVLPYEKEHVTPYLYLHPELFQLEAYHNELNQSQYRLTLDTEEDWELISTVYSRLYSGEVFELPSVLELFKNEPALPLINEAVRQKKLGE